MDDKLLEGMAVAAVMDMIGLKSEAEIEAFDNQAKELAASMLSRGLAVATDSSEDDDEAEATLYDLAVVSFAADQLAEYAKTVRQKAIMQKAVGDLLTGMMEAAMKEDAA